MSQLQIRLFGPYFGSFSTNSYGYYPQMSHNQGGQVINEFSKYVGLDTHKDTIAVAVNDAYGGAPRYYGQIANTPEALIKLVKKLSSDSEVVSFCYEAGPCGYGLYRQITS